MSDQQFSRRRFLGSMMAMAGSSAAPFAMNLAAMSNAVAADVSGYKALVCLFMVGGNDHYNTVLATDPTSWNEYQKLRYSVETDSIALRAAGTSGGVLPIAPNTAQAGRSFALHPQLAALKTLFDSGRAAVVSNVGTLIQPTTLAQYKARTVPLPAKLFSHNDQQSTWQSCKPEGATFGWGGRMGDLLSAGNANSNFTSVSAAGNAVFMSGKTVRQYQVSAAGAVPIRNLSGALFGSAVNPLRAIVTGNSGNMLEQEHAGVLNRAISTQATLSTAMVPAGSGGVPEPGNYVNPNNGISMVNPLAKQLQTVARIIAARGTLGLHRQVFYVTLPGCDTHDGQRALQADNMAKLAHALAYWDSIMGNLVGVNMRNNVTLFTASDFGRTLVSNGDGSDHGWGAHHFVVGGAVKGKNIYGTFPTIGLGHAADVGYGALLPSVSVEQYGATLGAWFGLSPTELVDVFPNLVNYSVRNLGFMA
jgi:uncharacterized protein (DUF1501 family)